MASARSAWATITLFPPMLGRGLFSVVLFSLALTVSAAAPTAADEVERVTLSGTFSDQQFVAGEEVHVNAAVSDEVFAAGGDVTFDGASARTIVAAGHRLTVRGSTAQDAILAGGGLTFEADIADDLVAAICPFCPFSTNRLHIRSDAVIGDDARLASRFLDIDGVIGGNLYAAAGDFTLTGEVAGNVDVLAERIVIAPGARIGGDLRYHSGTEPEIADGAVIGGDVAEIDAAWLDEIDIESERGGFWPWLLFAVALVLFGLVLRLVAPGLLSAAGASAREQTLSSLGIGFLLFVVTPIVIGLLMVSIVGIPLGVFTLTLFMVAAGLALATIAAVIGERIRRLFGRAPEPATRSAEYMWLAIGMIVLAGIGAIPFLGGLLVVIALMVGLGAVCRMALRLLRSPNTAQVANL